MNKFWNQSNNEVDWVFLQNLQKELCIHIFALFLTMIKMVIIHLKETWMEKILR